MGKYVFFDVDGTLWDEKMIVPESNKLAIKMLQENGHKAFVCTGRAMGNVNDPQFDEIGFDGFIAACGNHVEMDNKILYERNMSFEEEAAILAPFRERAAKGEMIEIKEIKASYQAAVDHPISVAQIYYVLHRHGWRKVMPRSRHPQKANDATIEASKKLNPESKS